MSSARFLFARTPVLVIAAVLSPLVVFLAVYGPAVGRGFISDDFGWIVQSRVDSGHEILQLFGKSQGFYRPIVATSFALNYAVFGGEALGYGWTNLALALLCAALTAALFRALGLSRGAAAFGAGVWLLNFHGINMALLWISGRTALLLIAGAVAAVTALVSGRIVVALGAFAVALFSKEEAIVIPVIWAAVYWLDLGRRRLTLRAAGALVLGTAGILVAYSILRMSAGAMTPGSAPPYYQFTFDLATIGRNILEYADRAGTFAAVVTILAWLILRPVRPRFQRRQLLFGAAWIVAGYGLTVWLPVRSSLYACFPSIGASLMAAVAGDAFWRAGDQERRAWALAAAILIPVACAPVYIARTHRWTALADLSSSTLNDLAAFAPRWPSDTWIVLVDDRSRRANLDSTFGTLIGEAVRLRTGRSFPVWVEPPLTYARLAGMPPRCEECRTVRLRLSKGHLVPE